MYTYWTDGEENTLRDDYGKVPTAILAKRLGRTVRAVQEKAARLGLVVKVKVPWTDDDRERALTERQLPGRTRASVRSERYRIRRKK